MSNAERHMVTIETEKTGKIELTPEQFDLLMQCALVGLDGYEGPQEGDANHLWTVINNAEAAHRA